MESLFIKDFRRGLDTRRSELTQQPGTLEVLTNGFVNQGGEIENRKAFVRTAQIADSFGLQTTSSGLLTFGSANTPGGYPLNIGTVGIPIYVNYQQLKHPQDLFDGTTNVVPMTEVVHSTEFRGKAWVVAKFGSSGTFGYYDGTLVYDFTNGYIFFFLGTNVKIATEIVREINRTSSFTAAQLANPNDYKLNITGPIGQGYDTSVTDTSTLGTLSALNSSAPTDGLAARQAVGSFAVIAGSFSAGVNKITKVEVNGVTITNAAVDWTNSNEFTAGLIVTSINTKASSPIDYTAERNGAVVVIKSPLSDGDTANDYVVKTTCAGDFCVGQVQFQILATTGFTITQINVNGVDIKTGALAGGYVYPGAYASVAAFATALAGDINAGTGTHGYLANATGAVISISKAVTSSTDPLIPAYFVLTGGGTGNGIFEVGGGTGAVSSLDVKIAITGAGSYLTNIGYTRFPVLVLVSGGLAPYQDPVWNVPASGAQVYPTWMTRVNSSSWLLYVQGRSPTHIPAVFCTITDSGLNSAKSNNLTL